MVGWLAIKSVDTFERLVVGCLMINGLMGRLVECLVGCLVRWLVGLED